MRGCVLGTVVVFLVAGCGGTAEERDHRISRPNAEGVDLLQAIIDGLPEGITDREDEIMAELTSGQRAIWALWVVAGEVSNGGFAQFFFNSSGSLMDEAIEGASLIGAAGQEQILRDVAALYPNGDVPQDRAERERMLQTFPDKALESLDNRWYDHDRELERLMIAYVEAHPDVFR